MRYVKLALFSILILVTLAYSNNQIIRSNCTNETSLYSLIDGFDETDDRKIQNNPDFPNSCSREGTDVIGEAIAKAIIPTAIITALLTFMIYSRKN